MIVFNIKTQEVYNPLYNNTDKLITLITVVVEVLKVLMLVRL